jgi:hypothetical protein
MGFGERGQWMWMYVRGSRKHVARSLAPFPFLLFPAAKRGTGRGDLQTQQHSGIKRPGARRSHA